MILLDTNLLCRLTNKSHPQYAMSHQAVSKLRDATNLPAIVPQNIFEFWAVATRARANNGLEMSCDQAALWIGYFRRMFRLLPDQPGLTALWLDLVKSHNVKGFKAHDVRLVAAARSHGINSLLTFNTADFSHLPITLLHPATV